MIKNRLSPKEMEHGQRVFLLFALFNVVSFQFLSGNIITLYALRLGASTFLIGFLYSFIPLAQVLPLFGRILVQRFGSVRVMGLFWIIRYVLTAPILFAPFLATSTGDGPPAGAITLIVISVVGFNLARGIAISGHNPILGGITTEKNRGSFISRFQLIIHGMSILTGITIALLLDYESPLFRYTVVLAIGIVTGFVASYLIYRLPEPPDAGRNVRVSFMANLSGALKRRGFRKFLVFLLVSSFVAWMVQPFLIVYLKQVYGQGDNIVILFTVIGSVGAILMALISGFVTDRMGAKPLLFIFSAVLTVVLIPLTVTPDLASPTAFWIFGGAVFFLSMFGFAGMSNTQNLYFFAAIRAEERVNLSAVYFIATGGSAALGSFLGGAILDRLQLSLEAADAFRIYFGLLILLFVPVLVLAARLDRLGSYSIRDVLNLFLSPRDLRALGLLNRLGRMSSEREEVQVIQSLASQQSGLSETELLARLKSPRFSIRSEALAALATLKPTKAVREALISEVRNHTHTTAYLAAEMIGRKGIEEAIPVLNQQLPSRDVYLVGKCMVALARLGDHDATPAIVDTLRKTTNPRLIIHAAQALEILRHHDSVRELIAKLEKKSAPFVRDEINLAIASIVGLDRFFYPLYTQFLEKANLGVQALQDEIAAPGGHKVDRDDLMTLLEQLTTDRAMFTEHAARCLDGLIVGVGDGNVSAVLAEAARNPSIRRLDRFCFLLAAIVIWYSIHTRTPNRSRSAGTAPNAS